MEYLTIIKRKWNKNTNNISSDNDPNRVYKPFNTGLRAWL